MFHVLCWTDPVVKSLYIVNVLPVITEEGDHLSAKTTNIQWVQKNLLIKLLQGSFNVADLMPLCFYYWREKW